MAINVENQFQAGQQQNALVSERQQCASPSARTQGENNDTRILSSPKHVSLWAASRSAVLFAVAIKHNRLALKPAWPNFM